MLHLLMLGASLPLPSGACPRPARGPFTPCRVLRHGSGWSLCSGPLIPVAKVGAGATGCRAEFLAVAPHQDLATAHRGTWPDESRGRGEILQQSKRDPLPYIDRPHCSRHVGARSGSCPGCAATRFPRDSNWNPKRSRDLRHDATDAGPDPCQLVIE